MVNRHTLVLLGVIAGIAVSPGEAGGKSVKVEGVDRFQVVDPMFECVRIVLAHRGESYTPAYIQGISGMAFRIAGPCPCAPTCSVALETPDLIRLLGYEVEESGLQKLKGEAVAPAVPGVISRIKEEIRAGRPVIVWHAFTNAEFDVVCGYDDDAGTFLGYGSYKGGNEGPASAKQTRLGDCLAICPAYGALIAGRKTGEFEARKAELAALEEAVRHGNSPRHRLLDETRDVIPPWRMRNGLACYDFWIRKFDVDPRTTPSGPSDRYPLGVYCSTRAMAPAFLREIAPTYPAGRDHLLVAADHFQDDADALVALRDEVGWGWGPTSWQKPDPAKAARSVELLRAAREAYARGTDALAAALAVVDPPRAKRAEVHARVRANGSRTWIDQLPRLKFGVGRDNTFCGALFLLTRNSDHPYDYADLMGLSGLAFRTRWANDDTKTAWCPSVAIGEMPDEQNALRRLTGWELPMEWREVGNAPDAIREKIVAEVDAGRTVVAYTPAWINGVICGYEDDGQTLMVNDYLAAEHITPMPLQKLGPMRHYLGRWTKPPALGDALRDALHMAVDHWQRGRHHGGLREREYWYGKAALDAWIADLRSYDTLPEGSRKGIREIGLVNLKALCDARNAASTFLKDWSILTEGEGRAALLKAAEIYGRVHQALKPLTEETPEGSADLPPAAREKQIDVLTNVERLESEAIAAIQGALETSFNEAGSQFASPRLGLAQGQDGPALDVVAQGGDPTGAADCTELLTRLHATGKTIYYPNGTYRFNGRKLDLSGGVRFETLTGVTVRNDISAQGIMQFDDAGNPVGLQHNHLELDQDALGGNVPIDVGTLVPPPVSVVSHRTAVDLLAHWYNDFGLEHRRAHAPHGGWIGWYYWSWNFHNTTRDTYDPARHPLLGFYRGDDPTVLDWQCYWLREYGVTGVILLLSAVEGWEEPSHRDHWIWQLFTSVPNFRRLNYVVSAPTPHGHSTPERIASVEKQWAKVIDEVYLRYENFYALERDGRRYPLIYLHEEGGLRGAFDNYNGAKKTLTFYRRIAAQFRSKGFGGVAFLARHAISGELADFVELEKDGVLHLTGFYAVDHGTGDTYAERVATYAPPVDSRTVINTTTAKHTHAPHPSKWRCPGHTPALFQQQLERAVQHVRKHDMPRLITCYNVAEWAEGGPGLQPNMQDRFGYLEAVRNAIVLPSTP